MANTTSWIEAEVLETWLSPRPCREGVQPCGDYPISFFLATSIVACIDFRVATANTKNSLLLFLLSLPICFYGFGFCGGTNAKLLLGRHISELIPATWMFAPFALVWVLFAQLLNIKSIQRFDRSISLSGILKFLAAYDVGFTMFHFVDAAMAAQHSSATCFIVGVAVGCSGYVWRELLINPSGAFNLNQRFKNLWGRVLLNGIFSFGCMITQPAHGEQFLALMVAYSILHSFTDSSGTLLCRHVETLLSNWIH